MIYRVDQQFAAKSLIDEGQRPGPEAHQALAETKTVAFFPPDSCRVRKAGGESGTSDVVGLQCGPLMSELEAEATRAGFSVVSWQTLRGTQRPIDYARENRVDILFEVNELSFDIPKHQLYERSEISFHNETKARPLVLTDPTVVARACMEGFESNLLPTVAVTLDMKMVSVADGRVHWYYRTTRSDHQGGGAVTVSNRYRCASDPKKTGKSAGQIGGVIAGLGLGFGIVFGTLDVVGNNTDTETNPDAGFDIPNNVHLLTGAMTVVGITWALIASSNAQPYYPPPESVLCRADTLITEAGASGPAQSGSSVVFETRTDVGRNPVGERQKALLVTVVRAFMDDVKAVKKGD